MGWRATAPGRLATCRETTLSGRRLKKAVLWQITAAETNTTARVASSPVASSKCLPSPAPLLTGSDLLLLDESNHDWALLTAVAANAPAPVKR